VSQPNLLRLEYKCSINSLGIIFYFILEPRLYISRTDRDKFIYFKDGQRQVYIFQGRTETRLYISRTDRDKIIYFKDGQIQDYIFQGRTARDNCLYSSNFRSPLIVFIHFFSVLIQKLSDQFMT